MRGSMKRREIAREVFDDSNPSVILEQPILDRHDARLRPGNPPRPLPGETRLVGVTAHVAFDAAGCCPIRGRRPVGVQHVPSVDEHHSPGSTIMGKP
jgi:hypothetical protein